MGTAVGVWKDKIYKTDTIPYKTHLLKRCKLLYNNPVIVLQWFSNDRQEMKGV